jgi:hypothetical protein
VGLRRAHALSCTCARAHTHSHATPAHAHAHARAGESSSRLVCSPTLSPTPSPSHMGGTNPPTSAPIAARTTSAPTGAPPTRMHPRFCPLVSSRVEAFATRTRGPQAGWADVGVSVHAMYAHSHMMRVCHACRSLLVCHFARLAAARSAAEASSPRVANCCTLQRTPMWSPSR